MWKLSTQVILKLSPNYKHLTNEVKLARTRPAALYQCCQSRPLSSVLQSGWLADSQPAESACSPRRAFHPAASALLPPHKHPSCLVGLSNPSSPLPAHPQPPTQTHTHTCSHTRMLTHAQTRAHTPLPLPPLHWAPEGEPVPSETTVQIAVFPLDGGCSLVNFHVKMARLLISFLVILLLFGLL